MTRYEMVRAGRDDFFRTSDGGGFAGFQAGWFSQARGIAFDDDLQSLKLFFQPAVQSDLVLSSSAAEVGDIPGNATTTTTLAVGSNLTSTIGTNGDRDWVEIQLVAGQTYEFTMNGVGGNRLSDPFLHLRDSAGQIIVGNDDGGPGLNSLITYTATTTGTHYLDAHAYSNQTGNYRLTATEVVPPAVTDSIDWGSQVSGTALTVYFARSGERFDGERAGANWTAAEKAAAMKAWGVFSDITNLTFVETNDQSSATFTLVKANLGGGALGYFNPPGETGAGIGVFNHTSSTWTNAGLQQGGYAFITLIHEFGHALGLAHPHDDGGTSTVMSGVTGPFNSYGTFGLNQGVFTTMSYNDGWATGPNGLTNSNNFGWQGTLSPLDIAVLQAKYGANSNHNGGNSVYELAATNASGTMYAAIWDTGGTDTIVYRGSASTVIDLRAATILNAAGGGGYVSYVLGIIGGFTIANGVVVENATGGAGNDTLTGNSVANTLRGNGGQDSINGGAGSDNIFGGQGNDTVLGGSGHDTISGGGGNDDLRGGNHRDVIMGDAGNDLIYGDAGQDQLHGGNGRDQLFGGDHEDELWGGAHRDRLYGNAADDVLHGDAGSDLLWGGDGADTLHGDSGNDKLFGEDGKDIAYGGDGNDLIKGGAGDDTLIGGGGNDKLVGGSGADIFAFGANSGADTVHDFSLGSDVIDLTSLGLIGAGETAADAFAKLVLTSVGANTLVTLPAGGGANTILMRNISPGQLSAANFVFENGFAPVVPPPDTAAPTEFANANPSWVADPAETLSQSAMKAETGGWLDLSVGEPGAKDGPHVPVMDVLQALNQVGPGVSGLMTGLQVESGADGFLRLTEMSDIAVGTAQSAVPDKGSFDGFSPFDPDGGPDPVDLHPPETPEGW
jgi:serralysin